MAGEIWRLVTAMFLHGGIDHLLGNCAVLYVLAMACEHAFGVFKTGLVYLVSGVAGSALSVVMSPGPSVGASGAIFGLSGAIVVFLHKHHKLFFLRDKRIASVLLIWAIYTIVTGFLSPQIDNFAHIGGFLAGASAGALVPMRSRPELKAAFDMLRSQQAPTPSSR
jgi:membrane associated rhomboid family serine protease